MMPIRSHLILPATAVLTKARAVDITPERFEELVARAAPEHPELNAK
jgi:hypothetical protein